MCFSIQSLCKNAWQPLGIYVPIIPLQQLLAIAKRLYTHYPYGKTHGNHQANPLTQKCLVVTRHFYAQYPCIDMPSGHQEFLHPISLCRNTQRPLSISPKTFLGRNTHCFFLVVFFMSSLPPKTLVGFSHKNEWHNVSLAELINGQKWWIFGNILLLVYLGFLHSFQF